MSSFWLDILSTRVEATTVEVHQVSNQPEVAAPVIVADGLSKSYDDTVAVRDLSFEVQTGAIYGVLGPSTLNTTRARQ